MPKKPALRKKTSSAKSKRAQPRVAPLSRRRVASPAVDEAYLEYLERYEMYGEDRPRLSASEFNRLDDELLDLLATAEEGNLSDDEVIRLHELEYLLLDEQSDATPF